MNAKTKTIFVLLGILILGLILGVMLQTTIHNKQLERTRSLRERGALSEMIESVVKPENEQQAEAVRNVVAGYEEALGELMREAWRARSAAFDSMYQELITDVLSPTQIPALDEWLNRNRRRNRRDNSSRRDSTSRAQ